MIICTVTGEAAARERTADHGETEQSDAGKVLRASSWQNNEYHLALAPARMLAVCGPLDGTGASRHKGYTPQVNAGQTNL
jgi:hypothetical protein